MIVITTGNNGSHTIARDGSTLYQRNSHRDYVPAHFTAEEVEQLASAANGLKRVSTGALTPAKAASRMRPPILRYAAGTVANL